MGRRAWVIGLVLLAGCATLLNPFQPGSGVSASVAQRWGCDRDAVAQEAEEARRGLKVGQNWIPQVGWNACTVLARVGAPTEVDLQQTAYGRSASWWYKSGYDVHLVSLEAHEGRVTGQPTWTVTYVGW